MKAYTSGDIRRKKMKKITKLLLGGALVILLLALPSQVKADWHQDNIGGIQQIMDLIIKIH